MQGARLGAAATSPALPLSRKGTDTCSAGVGAGVSVLRQEAGDQTLNWRYIQLEIHCLPQALQTQQDAQNTRWGAVVGLKTPCLRHPSLLPSSLGISCGPKSHRLH